MRQTARKAATYEDLCGLPEDLTGEILHGELIATPRPSQKHIYAASALGNELGPPFQFGRGGGPGGWWILDEPELHLGAEILVPDLAGWRRARMPQLQEGNAFEIPPDWVCEVLSPGTVRLDRGKKMPVYAEHQVSYLWLLDPLARTLEAFQFSASALSPSFPDRALGSWVLVSVHSEDEKGRIPPFQEIEVDLSRLWA